MTALNQVDPAFWRGRTVVVTGGGGFLGSHIVDRLRGMEANVVVPRRQSCDLRSADQVAALFAQAQPDIVMHLAAVVGGIGINRKHPGLFFYENALMGLNVIEQARLAGVRRLVAAGTVCAYPKFTPVPFSEDEIWNGYPEETNAPYGLAKRMLLVQLQAYREEYGFDGVYVLPVNLYGPRDNFNPESSHVIPALIRKCIEARDARAPFIEVWGTGSATREFLYVDDCVEGLCLAAERLQGSQPVNLGSGQEVSIRELVETLAKLTGFQGELRWDASKPDGQPRRCLDVSRAEALMGFRARTRMDEGLRRTIEWFESGRFR